MKKRMLAALAAAGVVFGLSTTPVVAEDSAESEAAARVALVVDASGSMKEEDVDGGSRMDAAKDAAARVIDEVPAETEFSLVTYGSEIGEETGDLEGGCKDVTVLQELGPVDADAAKDAIEGVEATGFTPIGESLRVAAAELGEDGERSIILVSDGIDTCAPPPVCEVAKELAGDGIDLAIHTVGFRVDDKARDELTCIAEATGGSYTDAGNTDELSDELSAIAQEVATEYEAAGTPFEFGDHYLGEGKYLTKLDGPSKGGEDGPGESFKLSIPEGHTARVIGNVVPVYEETNPYFGLRISAANPTCDTEESEWDSYPAGSEAPGATMLAFTPDAEECDPDSWEITMARQGSEDSEKREVEVLIGFEPEVENAEMGPEDDRRDEDKEDVPDLDKNLKVVAATPGTSYGSAEKVEPGRYSATILPGEAHYYKVPVDWGQRLVAKTVFEPRRADGFRGSKLEITSPTRVKPGVQFVETLNEDASVTDTNTDTEWAFYLNRSGNSFNPKNNLAHAGNWYVVVNLDGSDDNGQPSEPESYELTIVRDGAKVDGPAWRLPDEPGPEPTAEPASAESEKTADESAAPAADDKGDKSEEQVKAVEESDGGFNIVWAIVAGVIVVLLAVVGVLAALLGRRR